MVKGQKPEPTEFFFLIKLFLWVWSGRGWFTNLLAKRTHTKYFYQESKRTSEAITCR